MGERGRKSKYDTDIKPRLNEVKEWAENGASDKDIYENLGIGKNTFYKYKKDNDEFRDTIKKGRLKPIKEIKNALYRRAVGFQYTEKKVIEDNAGYKRTEVTTKAALPDPASGMILLKHWAKDEGWTNDPQILELRKKELKIREKKAEEDSW